MPHCWHCDTQTFHLRLVEDARQEPTCSSKPRAASDITYRQEARPATEMPKFDGPKMVTVRFLAPAFYRRHVAGVTKDDDPTAIIVAVAANVGCRASLLTGGKWEVAHHPHGRILIGRIKVNESLAEKILKKSGRQALFVAILGTGARTAVAWLPKSMVLLWYSDKEVAVT